MASNAIQSQGTTLHIGGTGGAGKSITDASQTSPCILTSSGHGLANGDYVAITGVGGMTELNGLSYTIGDVTTNTFSLVGVDATGYSAYTSGGTATPDTWIKVGELKNASGLDGSASEIDITNLDSTAKEYAQGLEDFGNLTVDVNRYDDDAGQAAIVAAKTAGSTKQFKITLPGAVKTYTFAAFVKSFSMDVGGPDSVVTGSVGLRITGAVTIT